MDTSRNQVVLKMIPRIDYTRKRGQKRGEGDRGVKRRRRPPAKFFEPDLIRYVVWVWSFGCVFRCMVYREIGGECSHQGDFLVFEGNHYRNGFMYKSFGMSAIIHEGVKPTLQELEKFEATPEEVEIEGEAGRRRRVAWFEVKFSPPPPPPPPPCV